MNRAAILGAAGLLLGLLVGFMAGRRTSSPSPEPAKPGSRPAAGRPGKAGGEAAAEEGARLRQRILDLEARLATVPATEDEAKTAEEVYRHLKQAPGLEDPKAFLKAAGWMADLRPTMTPIFVRKYRESRPQLDPVALDLALASGGPEAAALLKEILGNPSTSKAERVLVGLSLSGEGLLSQLAGSVPVDPELAGLGTSSLALPDPLERLAGVGVLRLHAGDASRAALQSLVVQDQSERIRIAALHALGRVGDRATLDYLQSYAAASFPALDLDDEEGPEKPPSVESALVQALRRLERKFPGR